MSLKKLYSIFQKCTEVSTDSRKITKDCLFFALKGENFDGNKYAKQALKNGAAYAVVSDPALKRTRNCFYVKDTLKTLQDLANFHRKQFNIPFIAITGTNGKTTSKELISAVLGSTYTTSFTKGNFNNHIGVPLTLLGISKESEIAVIEMGANHIGEIDFLCRIAEPTHGIITNIGKAHLEGFGSQEGIKQTKSELYRFLASSGGTAFVNMDERFLNELVACVADTVSYGTKSENQFSAKLIEADPFVKFSFKEANKTYKVTTQLFGRYNFNNAITAMALGLYFGIKPEKIKEAIENYRPTNNRSQLIKKGKNTFYLDAYNANPSSMQLAVKNFGELTAKRKGVILGDMLELGKYSKKEHAAILNLLLKLQDKEKLSGPIILVGPAFKKVKDPEKTLWFPNVQELKTWYSKQKFKHTHFLIKGSRGIRLEELLK